MPPRNSWASWRGQVESSRTGVLPSLKCWCAVIGGILIGLIETMWSAYFSIDYKDVAAFSVLAITLIFLPQGLFGRPDVEKV